MSDAIVPFPAAGPDRARLDRMKTRQPRSSSPGKWDSFRGDPRFTDQRLIDWAPTTLDTSAELRELESMLRNPPAELIGAVAHANAVVADCLQKLAMRITIRDALGPDPDDDGGAADLFWRTSVDGGPDLDRCFAVVDTLDGHGALFDAARRLIHHVQRCRELGKVFAVAGGIANALFVVHVATGRILRYPPFQIDGGGRP